MQILKHLHPFFLLLKMLMTFFLNPLSEYFSSSELINKYSRGYVSTLSIILLINTTKDITIGSVITVYSYVNNFLIALLSAPVAIEMFIRINDVLKRLN